VSRRKFLVRFLLPLTAVLALCSVTSPALPAQTSHEIVGRVEGHDFTIESPVGMPPPVGEFAGYLTSGARLIVRSGQARILFDGGGDVVICGAAQLQVLKSQGAITIALDYGTLRVHVKKSDPVSVFTPLVLATTVAIGGGERDVTVGLEQTGQMCVRAKSGAVRVAQQLSGESLLVPQFGGLSLSGGQINAVAATAPGCTCDADAAKLSPARPNVIQQTPATTATREDRAQEIISGPQIASPRPQAASSNAVGVPPSVGEPMVTVIRPALVFDASNPEPPDEPATDMIALVRSVRVREETVFHGTVEPREIRAADPVATKTNSKDSADHPGVFARIGGFFRKLFGG
jgi:hypothetical protein